MAGVTVDKVVVELEGRVDSYNQKVNAAERNFTRSMDNTGRSAKVMESQVRTSSGNAANSFVQAERKIIASSDGIRRSLLATTAVLAGAFAADKVADYADGYTRFTNQLKLANLSGAQLASTQGALFSIAQKYGVQLEGLGTLYGRVAQASDSLKTTQTELIQFSNGVAAALKIQGGTAESTNGALLQLSQLLGTGTVRAEEFNSVNEGARPILQAVASGIDKYKGSVAALRNDVIAGKVSSQEFYDGFLRGSATLEQKATAANFTVAASFQILNNAIGKYIGESDSSLSATQRFSQAMQALAGNLDTIVPALGALGVAYGANLAGGFLKSKQASIDLALAVVQGNAVLLDGRKASALRATAAAEGAALEVAAINSTIAALKAEAAQEAANIALMEQKIAVSRAAVTQAIANERAGFSGLRVGAGGESLAPSTGAAAAQTIRDRQAMTASTQRLAAVEAELAASTTALGAAQTRAAVTTAAQTVAMEAQTVASRAGALAMGLFNGAVSLLGGPVIAGALLAVGAIAAAIQIYGGDLTEAKARQKEFNDTQAEGAAVLARTAQYGNAAAGAITAVGNNAAVSRGKMLSFAGAVGTAAEQLERLADANRKAAIEDLRRQETSARTKATAATAAYNAGQQSASSQARFGNLPGVGDTEADRTNKAIALAANAQAAKFEAERKRLEALPKEAFLPAGSRPPSAAEQATDLSAAQQQLKVAQASGNRSAINQLTEQVSVLKLTTKYMKDGLGYEAAKAAAIKDSGEIRAAADGKLATQERTRAIRRGTAAAKTAEADRIKEVNADRAFDGDLRRAQQELLAAQVDATNSVTQRRDLEIQRTQFAAEQRDKEIAAEGPKENGGTGKYTAAEVAQLQALNQGTATQNIANERTRAAADLAAEVLALRAGDLTNQQDLLQASQALVRTQSERRDIELRLLDLQTQEERARLEAVISSQLSSDTEREIARRRLAALADLTTSRKASIIDQTRGPLDSLANAGPKNNAERNEAAQTAVAKGLDGFADDLLKVTRGTESLGGAISNFVSSIADEFLRQVIQSTIVQPMAAALSSFLAQAFNVAPAITKGAADTQAALATTALSTAVLATTPAVAALAAAASTAAAALVSVAASSGAKTGGDALSSLASVFSGGGDATPRANGGRVLPGHRYLVGEKRPEIVTFDAPGTVSPDASMPPDQAADARGGGGDVTVINGTGVPATARVSRDQKGGRQIALEPIFMKGLEGAGRSGRLRRALEMSPNTKERA